MTAASIETITSLTTFWAFADMANALMMIPNLIALLLLYKVVVKETNDCFANPVTRAQKIS
ncbi:Na+/alanine symporter [Virgibacillus halotolerans]|nr:Na+/alanine symporter [Virgibacillus halotolerans]